MKEQMKRRGLMAGVAALAVALAAKFTDRGTDEALAANQTVDGNLLFTDPGLNGVRDLQLVNNDAGFRMYTAPSLTVNPLGAAIQFWGTAVTVPLQGQAYIDTGAHNNAGIFFRTATAVQSITEQVRIESNGNVTMQGNLSVVGTKAFVIDHPLDPENKYLYHSAVEAPEQLNVYRGLATTGANGEVDVRLPEYVSALNRDFLYQLTVLGEFAQAIVSGELRNNQFSIKTDKPHVRVSWQVSGVRNDAVARQNGFQPEQVKPDHERGYYLNPRAHGHPETKGIVWQRAPERFVKATPGNGSDRAP